MSRRAAEVSALYESALKPRLASLEAGRRELKHYIVKSVVLVGVPFLLFFFASSVVPAGLGMVADIVSFALIFVAIVVAGVRYLVPGYTSFMNYKARYKREVVSEIFKVVVPTASYEPFQGIAETVFDEPGIFKTLGGFSSDDRVRGRIGDTPFEAAEVRRAYTTSSTNRTASSRSSTTHVVFHGLFFHLDFNRTLRGTTIVEPRAAGYAQPGERVGLQELSIENDAFTDEFKVYSSDHAETRALLTPAMIEQLLAVTRHAGRPVFLGFKNSRAYIGIHYNRSLFEPSIASTTSLEAVQEVADHFALAEAIVNELDLNTRDFKSFDDSLLRQPDAPPDPLKEKLTTGTLGASDVWRLASDAVGIDESEAAAARPPDSTIDVTHAFDGTRINYGYSFGFLFSFAVSIAALIVSLSAARAVARDNGISQLEPLVRQLPPIPRVDELVAPYAIVWLPASLIVGALFALYWVLRVRRVVIEREAILIWRGLRPIPRRYRRPPYGRLVRIDKAVYVGKLGGLSPINPSASPILPSEDEAKWIAAEMRRGLQQTLR